ncbi:hypothetical protein N9L48_00650 [Psychrosphaera sp.]|nr:hypothetical protein [Psychrosphaera sp.]
MDSIQQIAKDNTQVLNQLFDFLESLDPIQYLNSTQDHGSSLGAHVRHIIEHYQSVLTGISNINYDARKRDLTIETSVSNAKYHIGLITALLADVNADAEVSVICATNTEARSPKVSSSLARELVFLYSHTTHHMAIIKLLSAAMGLKLDDSFGKAASTRVFESNVQSKLA